MHWHKDWPLWHTHPLFICSLKRKHYRWNCFVSCNLDHFNSMFYITYGIHYTSKAIFPRFQASNVWTNNLIESINMIKSIIMTEHLEQRPLIANSCWVQWQPLANHWHFTHPRQKWTSCNLNASFHNFISVLSQAINRTIEWIIIIISNY